MQFKATPEVSASPCPMASSSGQAVAAHERDLIAQIKVALEVCDSPCQAAAASERDFIAQTDVVPEVCGLPFQVVSSPLCRSTSRPRSPTRCARSSARGARPLQVVDLSSQAAAAIKSRNPVCRSTCAA